MQTTEHIKAAFERNERALTRRPMLGQKTATTVVRVIAGLKCEVEEGPWKLIVDMGENRGGSGAGPNPGVLGRGALGSCLAMGYIMWAAKLDVTIDDLEVTVHADMDVRGEFGLAEVPAGYLEVRYNVKVSSPASSEEIMRVLDLADQHSSYFDIFGRAQKLVRSVSLTRPLKS